ARSDGASATTGPLPVVPRRRMLAVAAGPERPAARRSMMAPSADGERTVAPAGANTTTEASRLRPIERCILRLAERGMADDEIAGRLHRSPDFVRRVKVLMAVPRAAAQHPPDGLRPLERCIRRRPERGEDYLGVPARCHRRPWQRSHRDAPGVHRG